MDKENKSVKSIKVIIKISLSLMLFFLCAGIVAVFFLLATHKGNDLIINKFIKNHSKKVLKWETSTGTFSSGFNLKNVEIEDLEYFPIPNQIRADEILVDLSPLNILNSFIKILNAQIKLPQIGPILLSGEYKDELLNFNVYCAEISSIELKELIPELSKIKELRFDLSKIDLNITGSIQEPHIKGEVFISEAKYENFKLENSNIDIDVELKKSTVAEDIIGLYGTVVFNDGDIKGDKTALIKLNKSTLLFSGSPSNPSFNFSATSLIEKTKIDITAKGTMENPNVNLSSNEQYSNDRLLIMLATNKSWSSADKLIDKQPDAGKEVVKDLLDYFFLGQKKNEVLKSLGITNMSFTYTEKTKGFKIGKELSNKIDATYELEQSKDSTSTTAVKTNQKIGGEIKVNPNLSIEAKREINLNSELDAKSTTSTNNNELMLKYKKQF